MVASSNIKVSDILIIEKVRCAGGLDEWREEWRDGGRGGRERGEREWRKGGV